VESREKFINNEDRFPFSRGDQRVAQRNGNRGKKEKGRRLNRSAGREASPL
jgi:hypothetical protein